MKNLFVLLILFLLIIFIIGCHQGSNKILPVTETANNTTDDNDPPPEEQQEEMIHGMDLHDYPNPKMVPDYETMNVDQKNDTYIKFGRIQNFYFYYRCRKFRNNL